MAGFTWRYSLSGGKSRWAEFQSQDTETLTKGDLMNVNSGEVDLGATGDNDFAGVLLGVATQSVDLETAGVVAAVTSSTWLRVIIDPGAVYGIVDANARDAATNLAISGNTGAMALATPGNNDVRVVETKKAAADETKVIIHPGELYVAE